VNPSTRGNPQRNVSQGGGVSPVFSGGDERSEPENQTSLSARVVAKARAAKKTYRLNPNLRYRANKLDSSDSPGQVVYRRPVVTEADGREGDATARSAGAPTAPGLSNGHIRLLLCTVRQSAQVEIWRGGSLIHCQRDRVFIPETPTKRGEVRGFSRKSRSRMIATQGKIRWNTEHLPFFMGNTCPDQVPAPEQVIGAWSKFNRRFERRFPEGALLWRKEIKDRESGACEGQWVPHYHSFAYNCPRKFEYQEERGEWVRLRRRNDGGWRLEIYCLNEQGQKVLGIVEDIAAGVTDRLWEWWSRNWYEAMGSGQLRHYHAGTSFEQIKTIEGVRYYTSKYMAKVEEAGESAHCKGRWWGIVARCNIPWAERVVVECTGREAVRIMRVLRRYVLGRAKRKFRCNHWSMNYLVTDPGQWERFIQSVLAMRNAPF